VKHKMYPFLIHAGLLLLMALPPSTQITLSAAENHKDLFQTSDRCFARHNGLSTSAGEDISIGLNWRPTMMANFARDPYWQAGVRRETIDHPESKAAIEKECAKCYMPMASYQSKYEGREGEVFAHLEKGADMPHVDHEGPRAGGAGHRTTSRTDAVSS
jgi:hypothetical protein